MALFNKNGGLSHERFHENSVWNTRWLGVHFRATGRYGGRNLEERIESAPSRIVNYERYFDLCASVQSLEGKLDAQMELLAAEEASDNPDRNQLARLRTNIAGLKGMRESEIRQYNADARKSYTRARFRASELPFQLPADPHETGERTSCK